MPTSTISHPLPYEMLVVGVETKSHNGKTGGIPQVYTAPESCAARCPFKGHGCYAELDKVKLNWRRITSGDSKYHAFNGKNVVRTYEQLEDMVAEAIAKGYDMIRHNVAGDMCLPGTSDLDGGLVEGLTQAYWGIAYTYTHAEQSARNDAIIAQAGRRGFVVNYSTETLAEARSARSRGLPACLVWDVKGMGMPKDEDVRFVLCPKQRPEYGKGGAKEGQMDCHKCRLCARFNRPTVVVFDAHGNKAKDVRRIIRIKAI